MVDKSDLPNHSYSRTKDFSRICQRRYAYQCFEKWEGSVATRRGSAVHDAFERVMVAMSHGRTAEEAIGFVSPFEGNDDIDADEILGYVKRMRPVFEELRPVKDYVEPYFQLDLGAERRYSGLIDVVSDRTPVFGSNRLITGAEEGLCVVDWKTTNNPSKVRTKREAKTSIQLAGYCIAATELLGEPVRSGAFIYIFPAGEPQGVSVTFTPGELDKMERWLRDELRVIDKRWDSALLPDGTVDFEQFSKAEPGHFLCSERWCPFYSRCFGNKKGP